MVNSSKFAFHFLLKLEETLGSSVDLTLTLTLQPSRHQRVRMHGLLDLEQTRRSLLVQDLVHDLLLTLRDQEQDSIEHYARSKIRQCKRVSDIMTILVLRVRREMTFMGLDPTGEMITVKDLGLSLTQLEIGSRERDPVEMVVEGLGRVCVLSYEMLLPGICTEEVELAGEVTLNRQALGQLEDCAVRSGLVQDL